jgi:hypothetical protein
MVASGLSFTVIADFVTFDGEKWTKEMRIRLRRLFRNAAREWLKIIAQQVPVKTGFLMSSFDNLEAALGVTIKNRGGGSSATLVNRKTKLGQHREIIALLAERERLRRVINKYKADNFAKREAKHLQEEGGKLDGEGLSARNKLNDFGEKLNRAQYKLQFFLNRTKYKQDQLNKLRYQRALKRIKVLRQRYNAAVINYNRLKTRNPKIDYKNLKVSIREARPNRTSDRYTTIQEEIPNPAYPKTQKEQLAFIKSRKPLPPKTIKFVRKVKVNEKDPNNFVRKYNEYYYPVRGSKQRILKTPISGRRFGTDPDKIFIETKLPDNLRANLGHDTGEYNTQNFGIALSPELSLRLAERKINASDKLTLTFNYGVDIRYYGVMDITRHGKGTPWRSQRLAQEAFNSYIKNNVNDVVPPISDYLIKTKSVLKGTTITKR